MNKIPDWQSRNPNRVREMFARVAPSYDKINRAMTLGLDKIWRNCLAESAILSAKKSQKPILDLACGSGDVALSILKKYPQAKLICCDLCEEMLEIAKVKIAKAGFEKNVEFVCADASKMPFESNSFCACTISFGFRNFQDRAACLKEISRVLENDGSLLILEVARAPKCFSAIQNFFMESIMPNIAKIFGGEKADYIYLAKTTREFPNKHELKKLIESNGFKNTKSKSFAFGFTALTISEK